MIEGFTERGMRSLQSQNTGEVWLVLATITHADLIEPLRFCDNKVKIVSRGNEYMAWPFNVELPGQLADRQAQAKITIDNTDKRIVETLRGLEPPPPTVDLEVVIAAEADLVQMSFPGLKLAKAQWAGLISGTLSWTDVYARKFRGRYFTPSVTPGLYQ